MSDQVKGVYIVTTEALIQQELQVVAESFESARRAVLNDGLGKPVNDPEFKSIKVVRVVPVR